MFPTYVINLDRDVGRLAHMREVLGKAGVPFERVPGVLGRAVPGNLADQFPWSEMNAGHMGAYASHLLVAQLVFSRKHNAAVVLEDDVVVEPDFATIVAAAVEAAPFGWDQICLLGTSRWAMLKVGSLPNGRHLVRYSRFPWTAAGYVLSRSGAAKLLRPRVRRIGVDVEMKQPWLHGRDFDALGVAPPIVRQDPAFPSSLNAIAGEVRRDLPVRTSIQGHLWYLSTLGAADFLKCKVHNLITAAKWGGPASPSPVNHCERAKTK